MTSQDSFMESPQCHRPWSSPYWFHWKHYLISNPECRQSRDTGPRVASGARGPSSKEPPSSSFSWCLGMNGGRR